MSPETTQPDQSGLWTILIDPRSEWALSCRSRCNGTGGAALAPEEDWGRRNGAAGGVVDGNAPSQGQQGRIQGSLQPESWTGGHSPAPTGVRRGTSGCPGRTGSKAAETRKAASRRAAAHDVPLDGSVPSPGAKRPSPTQEACLDFSKDSKAGVWISAVRPRPLTEPEIVVP